MNKKELIKKHKKAIKIFEKWKKENKFPKNELDSLIIQRKAKIKELENEMFRV